MKNLIAIILFLTSSVTYSQTIEDIDRIRNSILEHLEQYQCIEFIDDETLNDDSHRYDTIKFYQNREGDLVYIHRISRYHYYNISGDLISHTQLFLINDQVVFTRILSYQFIDPMVQLASDLSKIEVLIIESERNYYNENGAALMNYESREVKGNYKDRFILLDSIPLVETRKLIWSSRCNECIEKEYMSVYRQLRDK